MGSEGSYLSQLHQTVIDLISATKTKTGLKVYARLDPKNPSHQSQVTDEQMEAVNLQGE